MPRYRYTSPFPAVLVGLRQGVEATVTRADGSEPPVDGSTIVAETGDVLVTAEPYPHAFLAELPDPAPAPATPAAAPAAPAASAPAPASTPPAPVPTAPAAPAASAEEPTP